MWYASKIALRSIRRNGLYSWIHVLGLSVSIAAVILIFLWVQKELSYDRQHSQTEQLYLAVAKQGTSLYDYLPIPLAEAAKEDIAELRAASAFAHDWEYGYVEYEQAKVFEPKIRLTDTSFLSMLDFEFVEGNPKQAFEDAFSTVITVDLARRLFGEAPARGKTLVAKSGGGETPGLFRVSAVVKPLQNSMYVFDMLLSTQQSSRRDIWRQWTAPCLFLLHPQADLRLVEEKLAAVHRTRTGVTDTTNTISYKLFPLRDYHLYEISGVDNYRLRLVRIFVWIAVALLVLACLNYINLGTVQAIRRNREMGIRKMLGVKFPALFLQLMRETMMLVGLSLLVGIVLVYLLQPLYNMISIGRIEFVLWDYRVWLMLMAVFVAICLFAGIYPACVLAGMQGKTLPIKRRGGGLRKVLVVFQFACSSAFILVMIAMQAQLRYIQQRDLGYDRANVLCIDFYTNNNIAKHIYSFTEEISRHPAVQSWGLSEQNILQVGNFSSISWEGMDPNSRFSVPYLGIDHRLFETLGLKLVDGKGFSGHASDSSVVLLNETAVQRMGLDQPIGTTITWMGRPFTVAGVVKDFHYQHISLKIRPLFLYVPSNYWTLYVRLHPQQIGQGIAAITEVWERYDTEFPVAYQFMDDVFTDMYSDEKQYRALSLVFALVAALISCLGLFGLVSYSAETRTREIAIRKVLGANVRDIMGLLLKEFFLLVWLSMLLAFPPAYFGIKMLLANYAYRVSVGWWMFAFSAGIVLVITLLTVGFRAYKAASAQPAQAVK